VEEIGTVCCLLGFDSTRCADEIGVDGAGADGEAHTVFSSARF
jgi:hypothetical protein